MTRHHLVSHPNNQIERTPFTPEEEAEADAKQAAWVAGAADRAAEAVQSNRRSAYETESDHLHFEEHFGEIPAGTHAAKRAEIKARFPK